MASAPSTPSFEGPNDLEKQDSKPFTPASRQDESDTSGTTTTTTAGNATTAKEDPNILDWDGPDDPQNPMNWPRYQRVGHVVLVSAITLTLNLAASLFAPAASILAGDFGVASTTLTALLVSIYVLGFATGPLVVSPLSELYGRLWIYHACNVAFLGFTIGCAAAGSLGTFLACRFLSGCVGAAPVTIGGGTIADVIRKEKRGGAMAGFVMGPLLGPVIGPIIGGFVGENLGWRWTFWIIAILSGALSLPCFFFMRETYAPVLLSRKAALLREQTGNPELRAKGALQLPPRTLFFRAIARPTKLLIFSPIVLFLSIFVAFLFGLFFLLITTFPSVFQEAYGFSTQTSGLAYLGQGLGNLVAAGVFAKVSDGIMVKRREERKRAKTGAAGGEGSGAREGGEGTARAGKDVESGEGVSRAAAAPAPATKGKEKADARPQDEGDEDDDFSRPEDRMALVPYFTAVIPVGFFWYGWSTESGLHWMMAIAGTAWIGLGIMWVLMSCQMYLVDVYGAEAGASALAALLVIRCIAGAFLPLAGPKLYEDLGYGWGNSVLGFVALAFVALPVGFEVWGEGMRKRFRVDL
ncbi:MFS transporter prlG [Zalerion maritima]|uniref:MFS transporter prlG n=1 Tax=Zalerion maritima TaxID=339359 RepID=A0AAD5WRM8_9PEZI|nr:MFS transporter prlG [Zalerion maritima]